MSVRSVASYLSMLAAGVALFPHAACAHLISVDANVGPESPGGGIIVSASAMPENPYADEYDDAPVASHSFGWTATAGDVIVVSFHCEDGYEGYAGRQPHWDADTQSTYTASGNHDEIIINSSTGGGFQNAFIPIYIQGRSFVHNYGITRITVTDVTTGETGSADYELDHSWFGIVSHNATQEDYAYLQNGMPADTFTYSHTP